LKDESAKEVTAKKRCGENGKKKKKKKGADHFGRNREKL